MKLHFRIKDWEGAIPLIERLVEIAPSKGVYRGMLARAMSRNPTTRNDAERHFVAALRLAPQDPELHYWLGLYYQSFGLKSRADTEFRATLGIEARHEGARKQLSGDKKRDLLQGLYGNQCRANTQPSDVRRIRHHALVRSLVDLDQ